MSTFFRIGSRSAAYARPRFSGCRGGGFDLIPSSRPAIWRAARGRSTTSGTTTAAPTANPAPPQVLLAHHLRQLKLLTLSTLRKYDKVAAEAPREGLDHHRYLLRLAELELIDREGAWPNAAFARSQVSVQVFAGCASLPACLPGGEEFRHIRLRRHFRRPTSRPFSNSPPLPIPSGFARWNLWPAPPGSRISRRARKYSCSR
jgi:hypothetical protein